MDDMRMKFYTPVVTGKPSLSPVYTPQNVPQQEERGTSFKDVLKQQLEKRGGITFSKHAVKRAEQHHIQISEDSLNRLNQGVKLAEERNLDDTLILVDKTAFLVNVKNNTVITTVSSSEMRGNVFTNIDGTVII